MTPPSAKTDADPRPPPLGLSAAWQNPEPSQQTGEGGEAWITTYIDVITLLLCLFVVLLAFANYDPKKYEQVTDALASEIRGKEVGSGSGEANSGAVGRASELQAIANELAQALAPNGMDDDVTLAVTEGHVTLQLRDSILFPVGNASLTDGGYRTLDKLVPSLLAMAHAISVEGHTDDRPIANDYFPSNWELSAARATRVVRYLLARGVEQTRLRATAYADSRPVANNHAAEGRAANRRVAIVIHAQGVETDEHAGAWQGN